MIDYNHQGEIIIIFQNLDDGPVHFCKNDGIIQVIMIPCETRLLMKTYPLSEIRDRGTEGLGSIDRIKLGAKVRIK